MRKTKLTRRGFLGGTLAGLVSARTGRRAWAAPGPATAATASVEAVPGERIATIAPECYGHFAEHLGGVIYDGIWVGQDSPVANIGGIRKSLVDWMKRLRPAVIRWPGGCFADGYHWRDGVGPRERRPRRYGRWHDAVEPNHFGTHEFVRFCRLVGAEPYIAANVGTGSPQEFHEWMEYANAPAGTTTLADERASHGSPEPFRVRYWGVGNESWGCGGKFTPEDYCAHYRRFTEWLPSFGVPLFLIASGPSSNDLSWTNRFFRKWTDGARAPLHGWSPHYYCGTAGEALRFTNDQWYELIARAADIERLITDQWSALESYDPRHEVRLCIDEWGTWHKGGTEVNPRHLYGQQSCLRDALIAALTLDTFNRHADKVAMGNIAQLINCLQSLFLADGDRFVATANFYVFEMYKPHQGAAAVRCHVQAPALTFAVGPEKRQVFGLAGSASLVEKNLTLTLVNPSLADACAARVQLRQANARTVRMTVLTHAEPNAHNSFDRPEEITPKTSETALSGSSFVLELPAKSIVRCDIELG